MNVRTIVYWSRIPSQITIAVVQNLSKACDVQLAWPLSAIYLLVHIFQRIGLRCITENLYYYLRLDRVDRK